MPPKKKRKASPGPEEEKGPSINTLMTAIASDDLETVSDIVGSGVTFLNKSVDGDTPITLATKRQNLDVIRVLLEDGKYPIIPIINRVNPNGFTALFIATEALNVDLIKFLIDRKAHCNKFTKDRQHPLTHAVSKNRLDIAEILLEAGSDVDAVSRDGTALMLATESENIDAVKFLLEYKADPDARRFIDSPIAKAVASGNTELINILINAGASLETVLASNTITSPKYEGHVVHWTPLQMACYFGKKDLVKLLIEKGANVNAPVNARDIYNKPYHETPLTLAITKGHPDIVSILLDAKASVKYILGSRPATHAALVRNLNIESTVTQCLASNIAEVLTDQEVSERVEILQMLVKHGADVNEQIIPVKLKDTTDKTFRTPLGQACSMGCLQIVNFIISHGADINLYDDTFGTPLYYACEGNHLNIVQVLVDLGVKPLLPGKVHERKCPLLSACKNGNVEIVTVLIKLGYSTEVASWGASSYPPVTFPIQAACREGHTDVVKTLLEDGADVKASFSCSDRDPHDPETMTTTSAITQAAYKGNKELITSLIKAGADINMKDGEDESTPIMIAIKSKNYKGCDALLEAGADVNIFNELNDNPLAIAIRWLADGDSLVYDITRRTESANIQDGIIVNINSKYLQRKNAFLILDALDMSKHQSISQILKSGVDLGLELWYTHRKLYRDIELTPELISQLDDYYEKHNQTLMMMCRRYILKHFIGCDINKFDIPECLKTFLKHCHL